MIFNQGEFGIYLIRLPLPFALNHINCYAIRGTEGWDIVDTGLFYEDSKKEWIKTAQQLDITWKDVRSIYITHYHPDHYGSAGWLQELSGAPVYVSEQDNRDIQKVWIDGMNRLEDLKIFFHCQGVSDELLKELLDIMMQSGLGVYSNTRLNTIKDGDMVSLGNYNYQVILTPGHADGHICFFSKANQILLSGDHLLPHITSNISLWPGADANPLASFFSSLEAIRSIQAPIILPSHGRPFTHLERRVKELFEHHRERLELMFNLTKDGATAYSVCRKIFGENLNLHEIRFAISETAAHLAYLKDEGRLTVTFKDGVGIYYPQQSLS